jgi:hypothetical protein
VGAGKANESEPLMKCRKRSDGIETRVESLPWDEPGGSLPTGQVVSWASPDSSEGRLSGSSR